MPIADRHREGFRVFAAALAALGMGFVAGCDDNSSKTANTSPNQRRAETAPPQTAPSAPRTTTPARPPQAVPGAAPSGQRLIGTWTVTASQGGPADGRSDRSETTTYRFEESGRVTVAGSKQCAYALQDTELKVDCQGQMTVGKVEFRGDQTMLWSVGTDQVVTLIKR